MNGNLIDENLEQAALIDRLTTQLHQQDQGINKAQAIILELEVELRREKAHRQKADMLLDALAVRYSDALAKTRELERRLAVRDELDDLEPYEVIA
jgi:hypothetical protein